MRLPFEVLSWREGVNWVIWTRLSKFYTAAFQYSPHTFIGWYISETLCSCHDGSYAVLGVCEDEVGLQDVQQLEGLQMDRLQGVGFGVWKFALGRLMFEHVNVLAWDCGDLGLLSCQLRLPAPSCYF